MKNEFLRHLLYKVRGEWLRQLQQKWGEWRTFFYDDCLDYRKFLCTHGEIVSIKHKWIGTHQPPISTHYQTLDSDEYDYEPGGLNNQIFQEIYEVRTYSHNVLVHPLDAIAYNPILMSHTYENKGIDILKSPCIIK